MEQVTWDWTQSGSAKVGLSWVTGGGALTGNSQSDFASPLPGPIVGCNPNHSGYPPAV